MEKEEKNESEQGKQDGEHHEEEHHEQQIAPEIINRAELYGWVPKEDFRGDPGKWVPADVFVQRADEILPIAKAQNRKLEAKLSEAEKRIQGMESTVKAVIKAHAKSATGSYESRMADITQRQIEAVAAADSAAWAKLEEEKKKLEKPEEIKLETPAGAAVTENPAVVQWKNANRWYSEDPELGTYADTVSQFVAVRTPGLPPEDFLAKVKEEVQRRFPEKFGNPNRKKASNVDRSDFGGGTDHHGGNGKKSYSDLPAEAKAACDQLVKDKVLSREKYVKTYFEEA